jgi:hypothetical protein
MPLALRNQEKADNTRYGKYEKEEIILFQKTFCFLFMVVFMQVP